jgi:hypothetical protein
MRCFRPRIRYQAYSPPPERMDITERVIKRAVQRPLNANRITTQRNQSSCDEPADGPLAPPGAPPILGSVRPAR